MTIRPRHYAPALGALSLLPAIAQAHPGHDALATLSLGLLHPLTGADHLFAMFAVGLWTAQLAGKFRWAVPASFVAMMLAGALLGANQPATLLPTGTVEQGIAASVLAFGLLLAFAVRTPLSAGVALAGAFALFHGYAHGVEAPAASVPVAWLSGFALSTAALHVLGFGLASWLARQRLPNLLRWAGAALTLFGVTLLAA